MAHRNGWMPAGGTATLAMVGVVFCMGATKTTNGNPGLVPFEQFIKNTRSAKMATFAARPGVRVRGDAEFERMKAHVLSLYDGVKVSNSFVLNDRDPVDCIDVNTQPGLREGAKRLELASPPPPMMTKETPPDDPNRKAVGVAPMLSEKTKDRFGNAQYCRQGFIPMRRVTLEEIVRYETLDDFFNKYGKAGEKGNPPEQKQ